MRTRPTLLRKTCPICGGPSYAEAKLPIPANMPAVEYNLDDLGALVEKQSLSLLLGLVELLPYKTFTCRKCGGEFKMQSRTTRELVRTMLANMKPVVPAAKPKRASATQPKNVPHHVKAPAAGQTAERSGDWEAESLDALFDYKVEPTKK
jgi:hypothetical protein